MTGNTLVPGKASETELCRMMDEYSSMLVGICAILLRRQGFGAGRCTGDIHPGV